MGRLATSWQLTKESWGVLKQDKELMWMPVLSFMASVIAILGVAGIAFASWPSIFNDAGELQPLGAVLAFMLYFVLGFITVYFHAAVVAAAHERLEGGDPTIGSALSAANKHLGKIFLWSLMVTTVNLILQAIRERGGFLGQIAASIAGAAWNLATFFVVPNLLFTDEGVGGSLRRSGGLFRQRWGETVAGHMGIGMAFGVMTIAWVFVAGFITVALFSALGMVGGIIGGVLLVLGVIILAIVGSVLGAIYKTALYRYAVKEEAGPFTGLSNAAY